MGGILVSNDAALEAMMAHDWSQIKRMYEDDMSRGIVGEPTIILGGTLLHLAVWCNQKKLLSEMLDITPSTDTILEKGSREIDNTILHEAVHKGNKDMASLILQKKSSLIKHCNKLGESPLYTAAALGNTDMITFLHPYVLRSDSTLMLARREDGNTILHASIHGLFFGTALKVAQLYPLIIHQQDQNGMTALHLIASLPSKIGTRSLVAKAEAKGIGPRPRVIRTLNNDYGREGDRESGLQSKSRTSRIFPLRCGHSEIGAWGRFTGHGILWSLQHLVDLLVDDYEQYKGLEQKGPVRTETDLQRKTPSSWGREDQQAETSCLKKMEAPLSMATRHGMTLVVERILFKCPCEIDYVNHLGENILHLAVKNRQEGIFNLLKHTPIFMHRLAARVDERGNTILHHAGKFNKNQNWDKPGTYFPMHWEYEWFKSVQKVTPKHLIEHLNNDKMTAKELFIFSHKRFMKQDEKFLKKTANAFSVVVTLMAATAFAALYTFPGGPNQNSGKPLFLEKPAFHVFEVADALTIGFSLRALLYFLFVLSWRYRERSFHQPTLSYLIMGVRCFYLSVFFMMLAFLATIVLLIKTPLFFALCTLIAASFAYYAMIFIMISFKSPLNLPWQIHLPI